MYLTPVLLTAALAAQDVPPAGEPPSPPVIEAAVDTGVSVYPPAYFSDFSPNTAQDMVARLPGFSINQGGGGRGFGEGGNVLINGSRPASKSDSLSDVLRRIPAASVERIEVVRGAAPGVDMQGHEVVANVIRRTAAGLKGSATLRGDFGRYGDIGASARLEAQYETGERFFDGSLAYDLGEEGGGPTRRTRLAPDGSLIEQSVSTGGGSDNGYELTGAYESAHLGGQLRATLAASAESGSSLDREVILFPLEEIETGQSSSESSSSEFGLQFTRQVLGGAEFEGSALASRDERSSQSGRGGTGSNSAFISTNKNRESIVRGILRFPDLGRWTFDGGAEAALNALDTASTLLDNGAVVFLPDSVLSVEELRTETFANARWAVLETVRLEFGLRFETSQITTSVAAGERRLQYLKPRALVSWTPTRTQQLSLRLEREVSQLSFGLFTASAQLQNGTTVVGNPAIVPDQTTVLDARYQWRSGRSAVTVQYAHRDRVDIIDRNLFTVTFDDPDNPGQTLTRTFEASDNIGDGTLQSFAISATMPLDRIGVPGGLLDLRTSWIRSELTDPITGDQRPFSGPPPFDWRIAFTQDLSERNLRWGLEATGSEASTSYRPREININTREPYVVAFAEKRFAGDTTLRVEARNITDATFNPVRVVYTPNRRDPPAAVAFTELRNGSQGRSLFVSLRRNF